MKKRFLTIIFSVVAMLIFAFGLSACQKVEFKVSFVVDGAVYATIDTNGKEVIKMPENPTKDGYVFDGWYWDNDSWKKPFTANSLLNAPLSSDMNVYCKWKDNNDSNEDNIIFKTFTAEGTNVYGEVSNDTESFSFIDEITTNGNVKYIVSLDIYGLQTITSKTIPLSVGNNTAYVIELIDDEPQSTYTVTIRRRPMYSVTFATNGGSSIEKQTIEESFCAMVPTEIPTKTGYTFDGWDYDFAQPITQKTTIAAKWKVNQYTITIVYGNGQENKVITQDYKSTINFVLSTNLKKEYYTFKGYDKSIPTTMPAENITITAQWKINQYSITVVYGNGQRNKVITQDYNSAVNFVLPTNLQRVGYTFDDYDKSIPETIPAQNVVITAKWKANTDTKYKVQYYLQNAENDGYTLYKTESLTGTTDTTAKAEIKKFEHFTYSPSSTDSGNISPDGSTVLKVYYNRDRYTVTFEANGGTLRNGYSTQSVKYGGSAVAPTFVKTGYSFNGWDKEIPTVMPAENITITAQWKINQYSITVVYGNDLENEVITQDYNTAVNFVLPTNLQRDAYTFNGYNNTIPTVMPAYNMTIYAQWLAIFNTSYSTITGLTAHGATFSEINIPSKIDNVSITSIGDSAFYGHSSLTSVTLPDGIITIGNEAFYNCSSLTKIVIPNSVTSVGSYAFYNCCNLTSLTIGDGVTSIGNSSFKLCTALCEIKYNATSCSDFRDNSCIFYDAGTSGLGVKVTIGKNVKRIPAHLFNAWGGAGFPKIIQIEFEENSICEYIGSCAFYNGSFLTTITLPDSITSIGSNAFRACSSLASVHYTGTIDQWVQINFDSYYSNPIYYTNNLYINNKLVTEAKITTATKINSYSFYNYGGLTSVIIGDSVTNIEWYAFNGCYSLKKVYYIGTAEEWTRLNINSNNTYLKNATRYYYIENEDNVPTDGGNYWHYDENDNVVEW